MKTCRGCGHAFRREDLCDPDGICLCTECAIKLQKHDVDSLLKTQKEPMIQTKVAVTFKCPDAIEYALRDIEDEDQRTYFSDFISKYVRWGECITVEFDIVNGTATVKKV